MQKLKILLHWELRSKQHRRKTQRISLQHSLSLRWSILPDSQVWPSHAVPACVRQFVWPLSIKRFSVSRSWLDSRRKLTERTRPAEARGLWTEVWLLWVDYIWTHNHSLLCSVSPSLCLNCFGVFYWRVKKRWCALGRDVSKSKTMFSQFALHTLSVHIYTIQNYKVKQTYTHTTGNNIHL